MKTPAPIREFINPHKWKRHAAIRTRLVRRSDVGGDQVVNFDSAISLEKFLKALKLQPQQAEYGHY